MSDPIYESTWGPPQRTVGGCRPRGGCPPVVVQQGCCPGDVPEPVTQGGSWPWSWFQREPAQGEAPAAAPVAAPVQDVAAAPAPAAAPAHVPTSMWRPNKAYYGPGSTGALPNDQAFATNDQGHRWVVIRDPRTNAYVRDATAEEVPPWARAEVGMAGSKGGFLMGLFGLFGLGGDNEAALAARALMDSGVASGRGRGHHVESPIGVVTFPGDRLQALVASGGGVELEAMQILTQGGGSFSPDELAAIADLAPPMAAEQVAAQQGGQGGLPPLGLIGERF